MPKLMRCNFCGVLQDEPTGPKLCVQCGGELVFEDQILGGTPGSYIQAELELDQVNAPGGRNLERHLIVTLHTPEEVPAAYQVQTEVGVPSLNVGVVLDISGSMQGQKIHQALLATRQVVTALKPGDIFSLVTFSSEENTLIKPVEISPTSQAEIAKILDTIRASGMTALNGGLQAGIQHVASKSLDTNLVILLSDGQANVGETDLEKIGYLAFRGRESNLVISTIGVGLDYNEALMVEIANQGGGRYYHIQHAGQIPAYLSGELGELTSVVARAVRLELDIPGGITVIPLVAAYRVSQANDTATIMIGDLLRNLELEIPLRIAIPAHSAGTRLSIKGTLYYESPSNEKLQTSLNCVTIRFVSAGEFHLRDGVVVPVVERVLEQMKAASVLSFSRGRSVDPSSSPAQHRRKVEEVHAYASLLGEERAFKETTETDRLFAQISASPATAKDAVSFSYQVQRRTRDFDKKKDKPEDTEPKA